MKSVLFIAYYFPPLAGSGVQKSLKFVKYLPEFNYRPIVLTVNPAYTRWIKDKTLLQEIPETTIIYRTPTLDVNWVFKLLWGLKLSNLAAWLQRRILIPDPQITWLPFAKRKLRYIIIRHKIDLVYITGGPFSAMLLGPYLKRKFNLKYVLDFRDEWTNNPTRLAPDYPAGTLKREQEMEQKVLQRCSGVVYTIPRLMEQNFCQKYSFLLGKPGKDIPNGFDEDDFTDYKVVSAVSGEKCRIVYTGAFYDRRNPQIIWKALTELIKEKEILAERITLEIIGKNKPQFVLGDYFGSGDLDKVITFRPNLPHGEMLKELAKADILLLYIAPGPNSKSELTGKIFEYMRSYKPILAFIPKHGIAAEVLNNAGNAYIFSSLSLDEVKQGLLKAYQNRGQDKLLGEPDRQFIARFDRRKLTAELASFFDEVICQEQKKT